MSLIPFAPAFAPFMQTFRLLTLSFLLLTLLAHAAPAAETPQPGQASEPAPSLTDPSVQSEIVAAIENVSGVDYIVPGTLTINGAATDFTLSGNAPMPGPVNVATVTAVP